MVPTPTVVNLSPKAFKIKVSGLFYSVKNITFFKNHFVRNRKLSLLQVIMYLLYSSKASMFQNISRIGLASVVSSIPTE